LEHLWGIKGHCCLAWQKKSYVSFCVSGIVGTANIIMYKNSGIVGTANIIMYKNSDIVGKENIIMYKNSDLNEKRLFQDRKM
jgi:hypothetical protein